jgi:hypothetical protein
VRKAVTRQKEQQRPEKFPSPSRAEIEKIFCLAFREMGTLRLNLYHLHNLIRKFR